MLRAGEADWQFSIFVFTYRPNRVDDCSRYEVRFEAEYMTPDGGKSGPIIQYKSQNVFMESFHPEMVRPLATSSPRSLVVPQSLTDKKNESENEQTDCRSPKCELKNLQPTSFFWWPCLWTVQSLLKIIPCNALIMKQQLLNNKIRENFHFAL